MLQWSSGGIDIGRGRFAQVKGGGRYISALHKVGGLSKLSELFIRGILLLN